MGRRGYLILFDPPTFVLHCNVLDDINANALYAVVSPLRYVQNAHAVPTDISRVSVWGVSVCMYERKSEVTIMRSAST